MRIKGQGRGGNERNGRRRVDEARRQVRVVGVRHARKGRRDVDAAVMSVMIQGGEERGDVGDDAHRLTPEGSDADGGAIDDGAGDAASIRRRHQSRRAAAPAEGHHGESRGRRRRRLPRHRPKVMMMLLLSLMWLNMLLLLLLLLVYLVVLRVSSTAIHICQFGELRSPIVQVREILILFAVSAV